MSVNGGVLVTESVGQQVFKFVFCTKAIGKVRPSQAFNFSILKLCTFPATGSSSYASAIQIGLSRLKLADKQDWQKTVNRNQGKRNCQPCQHSYQSLN